MGCTCFPGTAKAEGLAGEAAGLALGAGFDPQMPINTG